MENKNSNLVKQLLKKIDNYAKRSRKKIENSVKERAKNLRILSKNAPKNQEFCQISSKKAWILSVGCEKNEFRQTIMEKNYEFR